MRTRGRERGQVEGGKGRVKEKVYDVRSKKKLGKKFFLLYFLPLGGDSTGLKSIFDT